MSMANWPLGGHLVTITQLNKGMLTASSTTNQFHIA